jgi:hypothetical protein
MRRFRKGSFIPVLGLAILCGTAQAEVTFEIIGVGGATDISADGSVVVGNTHGDYETFRWTIEDGMVPLGMATVPVLGVGAGTPDVSADGTRISATILGADSTYATQGLWTLGSGWQELIPPVLPDGGLMDQSYGSAWGLSDDGSTLTGLYWRPGATDGSAHATYWTEETGLVSLGSSNGASRGNDASNGGSVVVGWEENPDFGNWWPTVWVDGMKTTLSTADGFAEASTVNPEGTLIAGHAYDDVLFVASAAIWRWNGSVWEEEILGNLPPVTPYSSLATCNDMTPDGSVIVGYNMPSSPGDATGFIWTEETGMIDVEDFLEDNGINVPYTFNIQTLTGVSDDGMTMVGIGMDTTPPWYTRWFIIRTGTTGVTATDVPSASAGVRVMTNPTTGPTTLMFNLSESAHVGLDVYDIQGRLVRQLLGRSIQSGHHEVAWDGQDASGVQVSPGIYFCRYTVGTHQETAKIIVVR